MTQVYVIAGPTASGKSSRALDLASRINGVVINADSMQVYDALPMLTAQPSAEDRVHIPHRLYGVIDPLTSYSAGNWRERAIFEIKDVLTHGQTPIITGGSGLYIKALMEGFSPIPDIPPDVRQNAIDLQAQLGNPGFHALLAERDPVMAARFHPFHTARLVRAWEVIEATGKSLAEWQKLPKEKPPAEWTFDVEVILPDRDLLNTRCDARFDAMMENGVLDEVEHFSRRLQIDIPPQALINRALGLQPLLSYLRGDMIRDDAISQAKLETRQYAKRQMTWFRHQIKG
ncbi:MAG: tRNA (adenosine(37)-N6)-dimethylallyltransferase MiaA [Alphaproteobacteria bacterium]|nr:tRNA (adenosine(37)-N6)-dimethylallyltransferase MiaA [Alphaproteobacteria bacterium]